MKRGLLWLLIAFPAYGQTLYPGAGHNVSAPSGCDATTFVRGDGTCASPSTGGLPAGVIVLILTGTCPTGFTEVAALSGKTIIGTVAANGDVGTTGGSDTITPAGSVSAPTFTGNAVSSSLVSGGTPAGTIAWPAGVPTHSGTTATFSGNALGTHAHELPWQIPTTTTIRQIAVATFGTGTSRAATAVSAAGTANTTSAAVALSQAVSAGTPAGTVNITSQGTIAWPAGVPTFTGSGLATHQHSTTATGTNSAPTFTGTQFDNRSAFIKAIFCQAQ